MARLSELHLERRQTLGIDPLLVLTIRLSAPLTAENLGRVELRVLDETSEKLVVAFADDPQLHVFLERLARYQSGADDAKRVPYEDIFDSIESVSAYGPKDRVTPRLVEVLGQEESSDLRIDIECWHPASNEQATEWVGQVADAVAIEGGRIADTYINHAAGIGLLRAYVRPATVQLIAQLDQVARIDLLPRPHISVPELFSIEPTQFQIDPPLSDAPLIGIVDSGVASSHPLLAGCVVEAFPISAALADGSDDSGHGTMVAGLAVHGDIVMSIRRQHFPRPFCRIACARVLDANDAFPVDDLWEKDLDAAIRKLAGMGARIINLSVGNADTPYRGPRSAPVAAVVDQLIRELGVVILVATGNISIAAYTAVNSEITSRYLVDLSESKEATILDPGTAAIALTVGGLCTSQAAGGLRSVEPASLSAIGRPGWPSPFSRRGPGIGGAVKPELSAPAGSFAYDSSMDQVVRDGELSCVSTSFRRPPNLFGIDVGTSFAVPRVTHICAAITASYPSFGPNLIRSLALQSAQEPQLAGMTGSASSAETRLAVLNLVGYGEARLADAIESSDHRVVLFAEESILVNGVHIYEVPIPRSFMEPGGDRRLTVALSFDPPTRGHRLDYMATRMDFHIVRGISADQVEAIFLKTDEDEIEQEEEAANEGDEDSHFEDPEDPPPQTESALSALSKLGRALVRMSPRPTTRSRGANQLGRCTFRHRFTDRDSPLMLVVRNTNRWAVEGESQSYAVTVTLEREETFTPIYADVEAAVTLPIEIDISM